MAVITWLLLTAAPLAVMIAAYYWNQHKEVIGMNTAAILAFVGSKLLAFIKSRVGHHAATVLVTVIAMAISSWGKVKEAERAAYRDGYSAGVATCGGRVDPGPDDEGKRKRGIFGWLLQTGEYQRPTIVERWQFRAGEVPEIINAPGQGALTNADVIAIYTLHKTEIDAIWIEVEGRTLRDAVEEWLRRQVPTEANHETPAR